MTGDRGPGGGGGSNRRSRRRFLSGLAGAVALAGCTEVDFGAGETVSGDLSTDPDVFGYPFPHLSSDVQLNPWAGSFPWTHQGLFFEFESVSTPGGDPELTALIEDVSIDGATATVTYAEDFSWWNGDPVTARDRWVAERIRSFVREAGTSAAARGDAIEAGPGGDPTRPLRTGGGSVALADEHTLVYEFDRALDDPLVLERVAGGAHTVPAWYFEPWLETLSEAGTTADLDSAVADLQADRISLETAMEAGVGCGPYEFVEVSPNRLVLDRFEAHPRVRAGEIGISRLWLPIAMDQQRANLIAEGAIDGGHGLLEDLRTPPSPDVEQLARYPGDGGVKLALNWRNPHLARRGVRRALCCLLPLDDLAATASWGDPAAVQTGLTVPSERRWLDEPFREAATTYPVSRDDERAAEHMAAAGYTREDGRWYDADGDRFEIRLRSPLWDGWSAAANLLELVLEAFGVELEVDSMQTATFLGVLETGDFDVVPYWTTGRPYRAYDPTSRDLGTLGYDVRADADAADADARYEKPLSPSVPAGDGSTESVDLLETWRALRAPSTESETAAAVETMARWWNHDLPDIDLATTVTGVWGNTATFDWPDPSDERYRLSGPESRPDIELLRTGAISPYEADG